MGQLYQTRREIVDVERWAPGRTLPFVRMVRRPLLCNEKGKGKRPPRPLVPAVYTRIGLEYLSDGDCILSHDDGTRSLYPPDWLDLAYEPV